MNHKRATDAGGGQVDHYNLLDDSDRAHHAIPHQQDGGERENDYITAEVAAELAGESVSWVHGMANRGRIEVIGLNGTCVYNVTDVEALIVEMEQQKGRG